MKILQVGTGFSSIPSTGAFATERTIHSLSSAIVALGHDVTVIDIDNKSRPSVPYKVEEVSLRFYADRNFVSHALRGLAFSYAVGFKLREVLAKRQFDIVNFNNQFCVWHIPFAIKTGSSVVYSLHNALWYDPKACQSMGVRTKFFQDIRAMKQAQEVICQNHVTAAHLSEYLNISSDKIGVVPLGLSEQWLLHSAINDQLKKRYSPNNEPIVLHVARIAPYKNQVTLVHAMSKVLKEVPNARLLFIGPVSDQNYFRVLKRTISDYRIESNVTLVGEIPYSQLPDYYTLSSVFVCPSINEAFGIVVMEAMAQGKAIIASNIETFSAFLNNGRGITVPSKDFKKLATSIITLLKNEPLRNMMGKKAKDYVAANYTWEATANKMLEVYQRVLKTGSTND
jgi:glycosyltransferase involved in cell wall biosynthesis